MFKEITAQLPPAGHHDSVIEFWCAKKNPLFVHADDPGEAWEYLKEKAFYDLDEE
jgi:hypothetical protein